MTLNDYQIKASATDREGLPLTYYALGLTGEAGEVADKLKKVIRDDGGEITFDRRQAIALELGDVLWYVAALARHLGSASRSQSGARPSIATATRSRQTTRTRSERGFG